MTRLKKKPDRRPKDSVGKPSACEIAAAGRKGYGVRWEVGQTDRQTRRKQICEALSKNSPNPKTFGSGGEILKIFFFDRIWEPGALNCPKNYDLGI